MIENGNWEIKKPDRKLKSRPSLKRWKWQAEVIDNSIE